MPHMLRRALVLAVCLAAVGAASPAAAHPVPGLRDPFDPALTLLSQTGTVTAEDGTQPLVTEVDVAPAGPSRGLPETGASFDAWILIAYLLVASGGAAVLWARARRPVVLDHS